MSKKLLIMHSFLVVIWSIVALVDTVTYDPDLIYFETVPSVVLLILVWVCVVIWSILLVMDIHEIKIKKKEREQKID